MIVPTVSVDGTTLTLPSWLANGNYYQKKRTLATVAGPWPALPLSANPWRRILERTPATSAGRIAGR
jgi:hypothetical protein